MSKTTDRHKKDAPDSVKAAVVTVSDSKSEHKENDTSGRYVSDALKEAGHEVISYTIVPDDEGSVVEAVGYIIENQSPDVIITTGGTGISGRDVTIEAVSGMLDKVLDGFGEFFRRESFEKIGSAALLTRAVAGVSNGTVIFSLPGSQDAVKTGMGIILKEVGHIVKHARE
jgi:molybdenum cofactor biosynthesis protein B